MARASSSLQNPPSLIEYGKLRFLIMDSPTGAQSLARPLVSRRPNTLRARPYLRRCSPPRSPLAPGLTWYAGAADDNLHLYLAAVTPHSVGNWVRCCETASYSEKAVTDRGIAVHWWSFPDGEAPPKSLIEQWLDLCFSSDQAVAVHCVAGLGRAPLLVAIALIEAGLDPMDAVELIRKKRRGAINRVQLKYVQDYTPVRRKNGGCAVM